MVVRRNGKIFGGNGDHRFVEMADESSRKGTTVDDFLFDEGLEFLKAVNERRRKTGNILQREDYFDLFVSRLPFEREPKRDFILSKYQQYLTELERLSQREPHLRVRDYYSALRKTFVD